MGQDLEVHIEVKIEGEWHHYGCPSIRRDYELHAAVSNIQGERVAMPEDATFLTKWAYEGAKPSPVGCFGRREIEALSKWCDDRGGDGDVLEREVLHHFLPWVGEGEDVEDVRLIFWRV